MQRSVGAPSRVGALSRRSAGLAIRQRVQSSPRQQRRLQLGQSKQFPTEPRQGHGVWAWQTAGRNVVAMAAAAAGVKQWVSGTNAKRLTSLEDQALETLQTAANNFQHPVFPCALIAGDVVILHLLKRLNLLGSSDAKVQVAFVDTFHLFEETHTFLAQLEQQIGFEARRFQPAGFDTKADFVKKHGSDLFMTDLEEYDRICKVEPFGRALSYLQADVMINGRRRDHGAERAQLEVFEEGSPVKCQPLAFWTFADCFAYLEKHGVPAHPLHEQGYPSLGDVQSTVTVEPRSKWFEYGGERSGRFQGMTNSDGSLKTECGIHSRL
mmetsp:Transcript_15340/g.46328  ORF Transcript_15340/g.46328 Transcript_15340/m.46328 type:complete len:324 (-) Transcript_15340:551-1522(-)|eukprot:CAMPEP_0206150052 /NCGR_PEP_ID=MMETSP1473-20131121/38101_1 /ASSEMBLY_ACC=CAM_ASM_001109 /TAXON_ID=1461547 /ORGANISM="Stichococcus sp, Strain RCC1054" /LENGTH=323 /DNA_ID=CAMNT_0053547541 /DNA_START=106 /DNA_END=1077 /DNA_ORIENTATION=+